MVWISECGGLLRAGLGRCRSRRFRIALLAGHLLGLALVLLVEPEAAATKGQQRYRSADDHQLVARQLELQLALATALAVFGRVVVAFLLGHGLHLRQPKASAFMVNEGFRFARRAANIAGQKRP
jgi:hypothetical protein